MQSTSPQQDFPPEKSRPPTTATTENDVDPSLDDLADAIKEGWQDQTAAILDVARNCLRAAPKLRSGAKRDFLGKLPFGPATFSKLKSVAQKSVLYEPNIRRHLPAKISILYAIVQLDDTKVRAFVDAGVINPKAMLKQIVPPREESPVAVASRMTADSHATQIVLRWDHDLTPDEKAEVYGWLAAASERFGFNVPT